MRLDRSGLVPAFTDDFTGPRLDPQRWVAHYLPQWTTPERSAARHRLSEEGLHLLVEADQPEWRPEDPGLRVSNVQTATWSGPVGSALGAHRHRPGVLVRTAQPDRRLWTPTAGAVEVTARASADPDCLFAVWLVGTEERSPRDSGEVCVAELFGSATGPERSTVRLGVKAHGDPRLRDDVVDVELPLDATAEHTYAATWDERRVRLFVDDELVHEVGQGLAYPLQLMVDLFELPPAGGGAGRDADRDPARYPKEAVVRSVRGHRPG